MASNVSEQIEFKDNKLKETIQEYLQFIRGLLYLTKKVFML
ncbi:hypothetical protein [Aestuariivivens sediminicola]|nr:hypothetical protein [Aestuariivivens sediminicola]